MELTQKQLEYWFASIQEIGPVKSEILLNAFETEENIYRASDKELELIEGIKSKEIEAIKNSRQEEQIKRQYEKLCKQNMKLISIHDREYPEHLMEIEKKPYALFVKGELPKKEKISLAIVGARNCTPYGKEVARWFGKELSKAGIQIVSGMAYGIDSFAHRGAMEASGDTYAVLGCGIDICYPRENFPLYMHMSEHGGVISEYGLGVPGRAFQFPMRNRIISGLCDGVLVVEARERSGSLITADIALEQGKDIFAIPGRVGDPLSKGCLNLVKQGAEPVTEPMDIIENFHIKDRMQQMQIGKNMQGMDIPEKRLFQCLSLEPKHINQILEESNFVMSDAISLLLKMELDGFIKQPMPNYYMQSMEQMKL